MKWIDMPPVWLLGALALAWISRETAPWGMTFWTGFAVITVAAALFVAAVVEFRRSRTTIIPREAPSALITGGVFRLTRNPIYLADVLVLLGLSLVWASVLGVLLVPALALLYDRHFIWGEENRLRDTFGADFESYAARTRRWV